MELVTLLHLTKQTQYYVSKNTVFWHVTPHSPVKPYGYFGAVLLKKRVLQNNVRGSMRNYGIHKNSKIVQKIPNNP
jgi:hypothetical protein